MPQMPQPSMARTTSRALASDPWPGDRDGSRFFDDDGPHYFTAPSDRPRTSHFCAIQPAMMTGSTAMVHAADRRAQNRPSLVMNPTGRPAPSRLVSR